jgi:hypothetical protein
MIQLLDLPVLRSYQYLYNDIRKQLLYSLLEVLCLNVHKSSLTSRLSTAFLKKKKKKLKFEVWFNTKFDTPIHESVISM